MTSISSLWFDIEALSEDGFVDNYVTDFCFPGKLPLEGTRIGRSLITLRETVGRSLSNVVRALPTYGMRFVKI